MSSARQNPVFTSDAPMKPSSTTSDRPLKILILSPEITPFAKTGGVADVVGALPKALRSLGHDVRVAMPLYGRIDATRLNLRRVVEPFPVPLDSQSENASIL